QTSEAVADVRLIWVDVLWRDLRHAFRVMRRTPVMTALAVVMIAFGTGANIAVFSVIDSVMLRSPFLDPDRLVFVQVLSPRGRWTALVPNARAAELASSPRALSAIGSIGNSSHVLTGIGDPRRLETECISASMWTVLGTRPVLGRTFTSAEDRPGVEPTIVLNFDFAQELGGPGGLVGRPLTINQHPVTIVGVMPKGFDGPYSRSDTVGWLPLNNPLAGSGLMGCGTPAGGVNLVARVGGGVSFADAERALKDIHLISLQSQTFDEYHTPFIVLSAAVGCVLLIVCLNVGGLLIERALARRAELAMRCALGATRRRLLGQMLAESLSLAITGGIAGVALAYVTLHTLVSLLPENLPHRDEIAINADALVLALFAIIITAAVSGIFPVAAVARLGLWPAANDGSDRSTASGRWIRGGLVTAEVALSVVVLIAAGLMIQTFATLRPSSPGFDAVGKQVVLVRLPAATPEASGRFFARLFARVRTVRGVRAVSGSSYLPMSGSVSTVAVTLEGKTVTAFGAAITPDYLPSMKIRVVAGRGFDVRDTEASARVALVNEEFARRLAPNRPLIGQRVLAAGPRRVNEPPIDREIVGVIADTRSQGLHTRPAAEFYVPFSQSPIATMYVIAEVEPSASIDAPLGIRRALRELQPDLVVEPIAPLTELLYRRVAIPRLGAWLLGLFAGLAVLLATVGLMMTVSCWVRQRRRELGIRMALGASPARIARLTIGQSFWLVGAGIASGCLMAALFTRYLEGWIYGVTPLDPATFVIAAGLMILTALASVAVPLRMAMKVDPLQALRTQ
ncbi:MAG TPA: ABC transporter permease, partial [Vicinamibacterales bacterium]|nr:ABC transporter permease [Vicinamibacterales bacterium]